MASTPSVVVAIDQGTTSTRCMVFGHDATVRASERIEHRQFFPRPGWVEHDAGEIWANTRRVLAAALARAELRPSDVAALGITNQRETTVVWDRATGEPIAPAIVWQDTRTQAICDELGALGGGRQRYRSRVGLPLATYFAGPKLRWLLDNVGGARRRAEAGELAFGTIDSWLLWNLSGGVHATDPTNASRTMLMDLDTLQWDDVIAAELDVPTAVLPEIRSSSEVYATIRDRGPLAGVPIAGILGDQQAAMFGQACLRPGDAKNTYGTGNFLLLNTGTAKVLSGNGLLTTLCCALPDREPVYALEGSIAVTGSLVQWLRDSLGLISSAAEIETLARTVDDNGGAYIVPAFSGLYAPHWRADARGVIAGLTGHVNRGHLARATLEATAFQTREVVDAMNADLILAGSHVGGTSAAHDAGAQVGSSEPATPLASLKVDGGMVGNDLLMQFQADILGAPVVRPAVAESTALGAAYAAGLAVGFWSSTEEIHANWAAGRVWTPAMDDARREQLYAGWKKAVSRTLDWA